MSISSTQTLCALAFTLATTFSAPALATSNMWDSATPWGAATTAQYAAWDDFTSSFYNPAPQYGSGATLVEASTTAVLTSTGNIYNPTGNSNFIATLYGTSGVFDVYLRAATAGNPLLSTATLNGVAATSVIAYTFSSTRGSEQEVYWKWSNVTGNSLYVFNFSASTTSVSLDQLALATVAVTAVPEPSAYGMMAIGLGVLAFSTQRKRKQKLSA